MRPVLMFVRVRRPVAQNADELIPVIPFCVEPQPTRETVETVPADRIRL
jgi:hypothetical protein